MRHHHLRTFDACRLGRVLRCWLGHTIPGDGSVVAMGDSHCGGGSSVVRVIRSSFDLCSSFAQLFMPGAAILGDGSIFTWGRADRSVTAVLCDA